MWKLIEIRTGRTRAQDLYQLKKMPELQDFKVIQAAREIQKAINAEVYKKDCTFL